MKKVLLFSLLVCCLGLVQAQSLSFSYNGTPVGEGDTLTLQAAANNEFQFKPFIHNDNADDLICVIACSKRSVTTAEIVSVCTDVCKDGYMSGPFRISGNSTYESADIEFDVPADAAMGIFRVTVYDTNNQSNQATLYVKMYNKNVGIAETAGNVALAAYPNPATGVVTVDYSLSESNGVLVLLDMAGKTVCEVSLNAGEGSTHIDVSTLPSGVYMYGIKNGNGVAGLKKLVVK